jgi:assimilatory nitrate reductase catalytic subunit
VAARLAAAASPAAEPGRALSAARAAPPVASAPRSWPGSAQLCACDDVSEDRITHALATTMPGEDSERLVALQARLRCGSECGWCLPAVKALVRHARRPVPAS